MWYMYLAYMYMHAYMHNGFTFVYITRHKNSHLIPEMLVNLSVFVF